jgi:hypothetical protein
LWLVRCSLVEVDVDDVRELAVSLQVPGGISPLMTTARAATRTSLKPSHGGIQSVTVRSSAANTAPGEVATFIRSLRTQPAEEPGVHPTVVEAEAV